MQSEVDVFEINDFTTASPWERFEYEFQELIRHWSLNNKQCKAGNATLSEGEISSFQWSTRSEQLYLSKTIFTVTHLYVKNVKNEPSIDPLSVKSQLSTSTALADTSSSRNDLFSSGPAIARYFGLRECICITPANGSRELIDSQDKVKILLSAVTCALTASSCEVAVFVQVGPLRSFLYSGVAIGRDFRISFDTAVVRPPPRSGAFSHLNQVIDLFKGKVCANSSTNVPTSVSIRLMSEVGDWPRRLLYESPNVDPEDPPAWTSYCLFAAVLTDPILAIQVFSSWDTVSEQVVSESPNHSDLDPRYAHKWTVRVLKKDKAVHSLSFNLRQMLSFAHGPAGNVSVLSLVREYYSTQQSNNDNEAKAALDRLARPTVSMPQIDAVLTNLNNRTLISQSLVSSLLHAIFERTSIEESTSLLGTSNTLTERVFKSAPFDSLTWRICHVISFISFHFKSKSIIAIFWKEIINELRSRWENGETLPWIQHSIPDCSCCLLHQKLQMLDCCIRQKVRWESDSNLTGDTDKQVQEEEKSNIKSRETGHHLTSSSQKTSTAAATGSTVAQEDDEGDDEFFDAEDNLVTEKVESEIDVSTKHTNQFNEQVKCAPCIQPEGRLHQLDELTLFAYPSEALYVPICQDPTPMTDDMLHEQSEVMSKLGTSSEGSALRVKMQLPSLLSDMQSFKAANPLASLEDFVRWYSPRDFEDNQLSPRMKADGNIWIETWNSAQAVPARRQKRLFDYTKEAVKVLHFLANVTLNELMQLILPVTVHSSFVQLECLYKRALESPSGVRSTGNSNLAHDNDENDKIVHNLFPLSRIALSTDYNCTLNILIDLECRVFTMESLKKKLIASSINLATESFFSSAATTSQATVDWPLLKRFLLDTSSGVEVTVEADQLRKMLHSLFQLVKRESQLTDARRNSGASPQPRNSAPTGTVDTGDENPFLPPTSKEFVLHLDVPKPSVHSQCLPHRMYALVSPSELRFAVTSSEDTSNL